MGEIYSISCFTHSCLYFAFSEYQWFMERNILDKRKKENEEKEKCQERKIKKENVHVDFHLSFMSICSINPLFDYYWLIFMNWLIFVWVKVSCSLPHNQLYGYDIMIDGEGLNRYIIPSLQS